MNTIYKPGDAVRLTAACKNKFNKFKKGDELKVAMVSETTLYLKNDKGFLTIHRLQAELVEKI